MRVTFAFCENMLSPIQIEQTIMNIHNMAFLLRNILGTLLPPLMCPAMESVVNVKNESIAAIIMIVLIVKNSIILSILMQNYCFLLV